jgi:hypothetical protein
MQVVAVTETHNKKTVVNLEQCAKGLVSPTTFLREPRITCLAYPERDYSVKMHMCTHLKHIKQLVAVLEKSNCHSFNIALKSF